MNNKFNRNRFKFILILAFALFWALTSDTVIAQSKYPAARGAVNDFANVIDTENAAKMETLAQEVLQKTGTAVVVATVSTIGENEDYNMYANGLYQAWGIGKKGEDKGVLIFLTVKERKIRIETGYGVEGILPDGRVGEILDQYTVPFLKEGHYGKGLYNAMYACSAYIAQEANVEIAGSPLRLPYRTNARAVKRNISIFEIIFFLIAAGILLGTRRGREMLPWLLMVFLSGGRGGGGGGFGGFGGFGGGMSGGGGAGRSF